MKLAFTSSLRYILAALGLLLATFSAAAQPPATPASVPSRIFATAVLGTAQVGLASNNVDIFKRRIVLAAVAPTPTVDEYTITNECMNNAFFGKSAKSTGIADALARVLDDSMKVWKSGDRKNPVDARIEADADHARRYTEANLSAQVTVFEKAVNTVTVGLRDADQSFRSRLAGVFECNHLAESARLVLTQEICAPDQPSCGAQAVQRNAVQASELAWSDRFEMLIAWATTLQGNNKPKASPQPSTDPSTFSLLRLYNLTFIGPANRLATNTSSVFGYTTSGDKKAASVINTGTAAQTQSALERLIQRQLHLPAAKRQHIPSTTFLVTDTPFQVAVRIAQTGVVARPAFGLTNAINDPGATFSVMSDEVARRRTMECVNLRGVTPKQDAASLAAVGECAGYVFDTLQQVTNCLSAKASCAPKLVLQATAGTATMIGTDYKISDLYNANLLPRLAAKDITFKGLADQAYAQCSQFAPASAAEASSPQPTPSSALAKCLLTKALGDSNRGKLAGCLMQDAGDGPSGGTMSPARLESALACYAQGDPTLATKLVNAKAALKCSNSSGAALTQCMVDISGNVQASKSFECINNNRDLEDKLGCYIEATSTDAAKLKAAADCVAKNGQGAGRVACLEALLPAAKQAAQIQSACSRAKTGADYLGCANALGIQVDPAVQTAVGCAAKGSFDQAAACVVENNVPGPVGELAACYSQSFAAGGGSGVAACYASRALGFNQDLQILTQCATATGGEPLSTGTCALGQLAMRELSFCTGQKFGEGQCFGENNTLRKTLGIGPNSTVADVINLGLDVVNGAIAFLQNPGATTESTLRNAGKEVTILRDNIYTNVDKAAEDVKREVSSVVGPGVYTKIDGGNLTVGSVRVRFW